MWVRSKWHISGKVDKTVVHKDYIAVEARSHFSFCSGDEEDNIFKRGIKVPVWSLFKVHRNNPLEVISGWQTGISIRPVKRDMRMPAELFRDTSVYDCSSFSLIPFLLSEEKKPVIIKKGKGYVETIKESFIGGRGVSDASLYFIPHGLGFGVEGEIRGYCFLPPSQVINSLFGWISSVHPIYSSGKNLESQKFEGDIRVPLKQARLLTFAYISRLEKDLGTSLMFRELRERHSRDI